MAPAPTSPPAPPPPPVPAASHALLEARNLERRFGQARALRGVSLAVGPGECHLVAGPNGAGKTTLLRLLAGLGRPSAGVVLVGGQVLAGRGAPGSPAPPDGGRLRRQIGLLSHQSQLYDDLTALENLVFAARLHGLADPRSAARRALEDVALLDRAGDPVRRLSRGMVQRVAFARAILHEPRVLLLDEPFTGLDPAAADAVRARLALLLQDGRGLVLVTHDVLDAWELATHAHLLIRGAWGAGGVRGAADDFLGTYRELLRV